MHEEDRQQTDIRALREAVTAIRLEEPARSQLRCRCLRAARQGKRRHQQRWAALACCAAVLLLALCLPLLRQNSPAWTITAYASGESNGITLIEGQEAEFSINAPDTDSAQRGIISGGPSWSTYVYPDGSSYTEGELRQTLYFRFAGDGIKSITYSSADCTFQEVMNFPDEESYEQAFELGGKTAKERLRAGAAAYEKYGLYSVLGIPAADADGEPVKGEDGLTELEYLIVTLKKGDCFTLDYTEQNDHIYQFVTPLICIREPNGIGEGAEYTTKSIVIRADIEMENGKIHSREIVLTPQHDYEYGKPLKVYFVPDQESFDEICAQGFPAGYDCVRVGEPHDEPLPTRYAPTGFKITVREPAS